MAVILVVDDEQLQRDIVKTILDDEGYETYTASSGEEALATIKKYNPDVILTDLKMEGMNGIELLDSVQKESVAPYPTMIIMTAHGTISSAVESMKKGAFDYLTKPLSKDSMLITVGRAVERSGLLKENLQLQRELYDRFRIEGIVGRSSEMQEAVEIMKKVSNSSATIFIRGESGTGKELAARAIHYNSPRKSRPFTALNCACIPENLFESELFGYEPGAFTGAQSRKIGLFEATNNGTLFLDEIGDLPLMMQSKLLRVIQDKEIRRLGGKDPIKVDVRIITATNKDIEKELVKGNFREELYYRLKVVTIELPALKSRKNDIPELSRFFMNKYSREFGKRIKEIDSTAINALTGYNWPGNIRQLESVIERAVIMCDTETITLKDIKSELRYAESSGAFSFDFPEGGINFEELEKDLLKKSMARANGVVAKAAKLLGMSYKTFWYRWEKLNMEPPASKSEKQEE
ncbi:MAG: sigma-54-dependent Fis family transcriptional regulator [Desulfobacteraceae bacterium]|nr:MAG: sigma-54-dependent Fis family transcriptional regulator [Desulfobacteraceae bacterium]RPJ17538.1 MAG: sigma-54-dependent Fis family transcriptional regulator [Desulfobacteraceae bacterium]